MKLFNDYRVYWNTISHDTVQITDLDGNVLGMIDLTTNVVYNTDNEYKVVLNYTEAVDWLTKVGYA